MLLAVGVFSLFERVLLACVQHRHGPSTAVLNGLALVVADGLKLYSKGQLDVILSTIGIVLLGFSLCVLCGLYLLIKSDSLATVPATEFELALLVLLSTFLALILLMPSVSSNNKYVSIGSVRQLRALILADLALDFAALILLVLSTSLSAATDHPLLSNSSISLPAFAVGLIILPIMLATARVPFDLPEAESELIAGPLTELVGVNFSLILISDYLELFI
jgi:NADH-quinone oxidoreductase subunit H